MNTASPGSEVAYPTLRGVWGSSGTDVYAVGSTFDGWYARLVTHYNGVNWTTDADQEVLIRLSDVTGTSASDVFAVGGVIHRGGVGPVGIIYHYDGNAWTDQVLILQPGLELLGVWSASPTVAYAVGQVISDPRRGVVYRYNGSGWTLMDTPAAGTLRDVWGTSPTDVYAVGADAILHFDGETWTKAPGISNPLTGVWGSSPTNVFAVGWDGAILHGTP